MTSVCCYGRFLWHSILALMSISKIVPDGMPAKRNCPVVLNVKTISVGGSKVCVSCGLNPPSLIIVYRGLKQGKNYVSLISEVSVCLEERKLYCRLPFQKLYNTLRS